MGLKSKLTVLVSLAFLLTAPVLLWAQGEEDLGQTAPEDSQMQWVWGEVVLADAPNKTITVKYLDYETDQEKEMPVLVDDKTVYDNLKSLDEVKPKDTLSIDYIVTPDNKFVARNISKEAAEAVMEAEELESEVPPVSPEQ